MLWVALGVLAAALALLIFKHDAGEVAGLDADSFARLAMGTTLVLVIGSGVLFSYRGRFGKAARDVVIWLGLLVALVAAYAFRDDASYVLARIQAELIPGSAIVRDNAQGGHEVELRRRDDGHFVAAMTVDGVEVNMVVDTGASLVVLTFDDAQRVGIDTNLLTFSETVSTANGRASAAPITLENISIGAIRFDRVRAMVARPDALNESLLGISFLSRLSSYEVRGGTMIMHAPL